MSAEIQPYSSFQALAVPAQKETDLKLSGGKKIPFIYSLGVNSTIPYIQLIGSSAGQKLFSWNEKIVVPPGQFVTVKNASFHPGDIFLQSGWDPGARPARVTVPVPVSLDDSNPDPDLWTIVPQFGVDTRRARRAYVSGFSNTPAAATDFLFFAFGISKLRSHNTNPTFSFEGANARARYTSSLSVPPSSSVGMLPLGDGALFSDTVHDLLDVATWAYRDVNLDNQSGAIHYVIEYV